MIYRFGGYEVDTARLEVRHEGESLHAEPQVFDVLRYLIEHRDRVITKIELLDEVWGGAFVSESALTSRIKSVRQLLGDSGKSQHVVRTVHGRGYQFVADVVGHEADATDRPGHSGTTPDDTGAGDTDGTVPATATPTGTISFLFSDIEGSSALWEHHGDLMPNVIGRHDEILHRGVEANRGVVFSTAGDGVAAAFELASDAIAAARLIRSALDAEPWPSPIQLRVRLGVHSGEAARSNGDYHGAVVNRAARVMSAAYGGQTLISDVTVGLASSEDGLIDQGVCQIDPSMPTMRLWQLDGPSFPPLAGAVASSLPRMRTALIGRDLDLDRVVDATADHRIVSIVGPGGAGKTTLALAAANAAMTSFPAGVVFVELAAVSDAGGILQAVAQAARVEGAAAGTCADAGDQSH